jgi:hypothetical protein
MPLRRAVQWRKVLDIEAGASATFDHKVEAVMRNRASYAAFRPGQLGPVKAKFLADAAYNARVKDLARSAEGNFRLPPLVIDYHHDWALSSFLMPVVETTSAVG